MNALNTTTDCCSQNYLDTFCEAATSPYGCLVVCNKVAVATKKWWQLSAIELVLLNMLTASLHSCASRDIPVFLPVTSPQVCDTFLSSCPSQAYRYVTHSCRLPHHKCLTCSWFKIVGASSLADVPVIAWC